MLATIFAHPRVIGVYPPVAIGTTQVKCKMMSADCDDCSWEEVYALLGCEDMATDDELHPA